MTHRLAVAALAVTAAAVLAGCGSDDGAHDDGHRHSSTPAAFSATAAPATASAAAPAADATKLEIRGGALVSGPATIEVKRGAQVRLQVSTDAPDELHIHGYDKTAPLAPGAAATVEFTADIPGLFEIELHEAGKRIAQLRVN